MKKLFLDYETSCQIDLPTCGRMKYCHNASLYIQIASWCFDDGDIHTWTCHEGPFPVEIFEDSILYAFNAQFEYMVTQQVLGITIPLSRVVDVQALCGRYGLPQSLGVVSRIVCPDKVKEAAGTSLIKVFKSAPKEACQGPKWEEYIHYNRMDVESMREVVRHLPSDHLSEREQAIWEMNCRINLRGLPCDVKEAQKILEVTRAHIDERVSRLPRLSNGKITTVNQTARMVDFINETLGREILSDLSRQTVETLMESPLWGELLENCQEILKIRNEVGVSSLNKYEHIINKAHNNRLYDNSLYYGAHTGRTAGRGFQLLNLPRAKVANPEAAIASFFDGTVRDGNPAQVAKALIRSMIKAQEGYFIYCADYSAIEYVLLMWLAEEEEALRRFEAGFCQYKDMATIIYKTPYEEITSTQRQGGKAGILGCGYAMGAESLVAYAVTLKITLSLDEARRIVDAFRSTRTRTKRMWYALLNCAMEAVRYPGRTFSTNRVAFRKVKDRVGCAWLRVTLPSGRSMYYRQPRIMEGKYGESLTYMGVNPKTKQYSRLFTTPGKITENIIQALGRDVLYDGKFALEKHGFSIVGSIYDEVICEEEGYDESKFELMKRCMCTTEKWSAGCPLRAAGYIEKRYKKD